MYFPDLTPYSYSYEYNNNNILNIGWLSNTHEFNKEGKISELFLENLNKILNTYVVNLYRGWHDCEFCENRSSYRGLGNGEIWIPNKNNQIIYVSPTLIWHYIKEHNYIPPIEFIQACEEFDFNSEWNPEEVIEKYYIPKKYNKDDIKMDNTLQIELINSIAESISLSIDNEIIEDLLKNKLSR